MLRSESPEATADDIRDAYRLAARRFHPDANRNEGAEHAFRDITTAYEVLSNPVTRAEYDVARHKFKDEPGYFTLRVTPSKRVLAMLDEPQVLYLLLEIVPMRQAAQEKQQAARLNLTLVLDRSTSMKGARLERVKYAAQHIIDQLTPEDVLSVVTFSDRADVLIPASMASDKRDLRAMITMIQADGGRRSTTALPPGGAVPAPPGELHGQSRGPAHRGRTFGDEELPELADEAAGEGISIAHGDR